MDNKVLYGIIGVVVVVGAVFFLTSNNTPASNDAMVKKDAATQGTDAAKGDSMEADSMDKGTEAAAGTIVDVAAGNPDFSTLVAAVQAAGLAEALSGPGPFTVFAPTNEAFAKLPAGTVESLLLPENKHKLVKILQYHVVSGEVLSTALSDGQQAETLAGLPITVGVTANGVTINNSNVVTADLKTSNGVIHVIDTVLLPE